MTNDDWSNYLHEVLFTINNRLKVLETRDSNTELQQLLDRVKALEGYFERVLGDLEYWSKVSTKSDVELSKRLTNIEEWKDMHYNWRNKGLTDHENRIKKLEDVLRDPFRGYYTSIDCRRDKNFVDKKMIDKQVWEDIKSKIIPLAKYYREHRKISYDTTYVEECLSKIVEII